MSSFYQMMSFIQNRAIDKYIEYEGEIISIPVSKVCVGDSVCYNNNIYLVKASSGTKVKLLLKSDTKIEDEANIDELIKFEIKYFKDYVVARMGSECFCDSKETNCFLDFRYWEKVIHDKSIVEPSKKIRFRLALYSNNNNKTYLIAVPVSLIPRRDRQMHYVYSTNTKAERIYTKVYLGTYEECESFLSKLDAFKRIFHGISASNFTVDEWNNKEVYE